MMKKIVFGAIFAIFATALIGISIIFLVGYRLSAFGKKMESVHIGMTKASLVTSLGDPRRVLSGEVENTDIFIYSFKVPPVPVSYLFYIYENKVVKIERRD